MRLILAAALAACCAAPALAETRPLILNPADTDGDGKVSDAERFTRLASVEAAPAPVVAFQRDRPLVGLRPPQVDAPGPLEMARRIAPASEFETALEDRFNRELERRGEIRVRPIERTRSD